jgi:hypothetical protein
VERFPGVVSDNHTNRYVIEEKEEVMKKFLLVFLIIVFVSNATNAQLWKIRRYEAIASVGTTQFYGDIGGYSKGDNLLGIKDFNFSHTRYNFTTAFKYRILQDVSVRLNLALGSFHSTDKKGSNEARGFESVTSFIEPSLLGEYYFIKNKAENNFKNMKGTRSGFKAIFPTLDFYIFGGIGGLSYKVKPNAKLAQFVTTKTGFTPVIPAGIGVNMFYNRNYNFGVELSGRFTFSDNIDGYTSIHSKSNDLYHFLNFTFTYKINTGDNGLPMLRSYSKMMGR